MHHVKGSGSSPSSRGRKGSRELHEEWGRAAWRTTGNWRGGVPPLPYAFRLLLLCPDYPVPFYSVDYWRLESLLRSPSMLSWIFNLLFLYFISQLRFVSCGSLSCFLFLMSRCGTGDSNCLTSASKDWFSDILGFIPHHNFFPTPSLLTWPCRNVFIYRCFSHDGKLSLSYLRCLSSFHFSD